MFVCLCVCLSPPEAKDAETGPKAQNLGQRPKKRAEGPKTGMGVFGRNTDRDYAGCRPALIEFNLNLKVNLFSFVMNNSEAGVHKIEYFNKGKEIQNFGEKKFQQH